MIAGIGGTIASAALLPNDAVAALAPAGAGSAADVDGGESAKLFLPADELQPATYDRLPLEWSKARLATLCDMLEAQGFDGILLTNQWNIIYFTGLWHTTTERMIHCFIPTATRTPIWFYPALDRELIRSWWYDDGEMYFDWVDAEGSMPQEGRYQAGPTHDLWQWLVDGIAKRGFAGKKLAVDTELVPTKQAKVAETLGTPMASAAQLCTFMRIRKTPEELALARRAYSVFDRVHAFTRDMIMTHGTDLYDYEIGLAGEKFALDIMNSELGHDGTPHGATGVQVVVRVRAGELTGYPHPNQFHANKIRSGQTVQVATVVSIGGCGGECYRPYLVGPRSALQEKIWTVTRDTCLIQQDLSRTGTECAAVAEAIHAHQVKSGMQANIYHRPAHGEGMEGHQPPYIALGDHTVLEPGMFFSVEPSLYAPQAGTGANFSDGFVVREEGPALQMSRLPWSEEWAWIEI